MYSSEPVEVSNAGITWLCNCSTTPDEVAISKVDAHAVGVRAIPFSHVAFCFLIQ